MPSQTLIGVVVVRSALDKSTELRCGRSGDIEKRLPQWRRNLMAQKASPFGS
jgi:hypothetical protein